MKLLIAAVLIIHGLIVAAQSSGRFGSRPPSELQNPGWVSWWPTNMGRSWLFSGLGLERAPITTWIVGLLWLAGGIALVAAGLSVLGFVIPTDMWRSLALAGAALSLLMLVVYLHPITIIGTGLSIAILVALRWVDWPPASLIP